MKRTTPTAIVLTALIAAVLGWLLELMLVMTGRAALVLPLTLGPALALLGVALLLVAWPVRQAARGKRRIGYRHATAVLGFAKASSIVAALLGGGALGALIFFVTRQVVAQGTVLVFAIIAVGALVQLVAGLLAEHWCVLPPDEDDAAQAANSAA